MSTPLVRRPSRAIAAIVALTALIVALHGLGRLGLRGPTGVSRRELDVWLEDPLSVAATLARWMALALSYYLAVVVLAVALTGDRLATTPLRYLVPSGLASTIGIALGVGAVAIPLATHMHQVADAPQIAAPDAEVLQLTELEQPPTLRPIQDAEGSDPGSIPRRDEGFEAPAIETAAEERWTVEPGDSFWAIAEEHLRDEWNRTDLSDAEVAIYWRTLIDANVERLIEPGNPDLLLPGQELILPETPSPS